MIGVAVVGYGYWGPNLVRNFCRDAGRASRLGLRPAARSAWRQFRAAIRPSRSPTTSTRSCAIRAFDAVAIATPVSTHFELAMRALLAGKHVFVEKPIASSAEEAQRLVDEAARRRLVLAVDHTFVHTGAVRKMRELVAGEPRRNLLLRLGPREPRAVPARRQRHLGSRRARPVDHGLRAAGSSRSRSRRRA